MTAPPRARTKTPETSKSWAFDIGRRTDFPKARSSEVAFFDLSAVVVAAVYAWTVGAMFVNVAVINKQSKIFFMTISVFNVVVGMWRATRADRFPHTLALSSTTKIMHYFQLFCAGTADRTGNKVIAVIRNSIIIGPLNNQAADPVALESTHREAE
jgi:hypothetical protein